jgi:hypothetical protein
MLSVFTFLTVRFYVRGPSGPLRWSGLWRKRAATTVRQENGRFPGSCQKSTVEVGKSQENQSRNQIQLAQRAQSFLAAAWLRRLYSTVTCIWQRGTRGEDRAISLFGSCPSVLIPKPSQRLNSFGSSLS